MSRFISFSKALLFSQFLIGFLIVFHLLVVFLTISGIDFFMKYTWGGQVTAIEEFIRLEIISIVASCICFVLIFLRKSAQKKIWLVMSRNGLFLFFLLFSLNTLGNLFAVSLLEKSFALITLSLAFFLLRLIIEPMKLGKIAS